MPNNGRKYGTRRYPGMKNRPKRKSRLRSRTAAPAHHHHGHSHSHAHIHCIACGKHLDVEMFGEPDGADWIRCQHGTDYPHCLACSDNARELLAEHDRSDEPVKRAVAWH